MGRYLDIAAGVITELGTDSQCEISEISPLRAPDQGCEISEITPPGETWGAAAASAKVVLLHCPPGVPEAWVQGVADLLATARPASCPDAKWQTLREDAYHFLRDHAAQAHALGWTGLDLFGVHPVKPWARLDVMGLVPLLRGREVAALNRDGATIKMAGGQVLTYRRVQVTCPTDTCLIWGLR